MIPGPRQHRRSASYLTLCTVLTALMFLLAACGGDDSDDVNDVATEPESTPTQTAVAESDDEPAPTPEPDATEVAGEDAIDDTADPEPTPTEVVDEPGADPTPESADDVDFAPELAGLTDWRNTDPVTLEDLRGAPVVLVFWNSI